MNTVLFSDPNHPSFPAIRRWAAANGFAIAHSARDIDGGGILFLISCTEIIPAEIRNRFDRVFLIHESAVPKGRGWSPLAWQILEGQNDIPISLMAAEDRVDSGAVYARVTVKLEGYELAQEIHAKVAEAKTRLMDEALKGSLTPEPQTGEPSYYRRRTPEDSRLDPHKTIAEQFDLLRICEPRFPAFFEYRGHIYTISLSRRGFVPEDEWDEWDECSASL